MSNQIKQIGVLSDGTNYFKHGYGIDFSNKNYKISIDFGPKGEWNGFDAWRLFSFSQDNDIKIDFKNENEIEQKLLEDIKKGILEKRKQLYFRNN